MTGLIGLDQGVRRRVISRTGYRMTKGEVAGRVGGTESGLGGVLVLKDSLLVFASGGGAPDWDPDG